MSDDDGTIIARLVTDIRTLPADQWDACAGGGNPFVSHAFLSALEEAGCVGGRTGWVPYHLAIDADDGGLAGVMPLYAKLHSQGEYIFDHGWANALERAGGQYYPKLLCASPFSPVTGPRLLARGGDDRIRRALVSGAIEAAKQLPASSLHLNFLTEAEWRLAADMGLFLRTDQQFHWFNRGYATFDDFLADLSSRKRKAIRKERREALDSDIAIDCIGGGDLTEAHWDAFYAFYMDTGGRKWGRPYLNRRFFSLLGERMADRVALFMCRRQGRWIAGALNLIGDEALYGRYWGCVEEHRFLHFETCYYRAIEFAIERGIGRVEAGAQGPHKIARGYLPTPVRSAHWIADRGFADAVRRYLDRERDAVAEEIGHLSEFAPFRRDLPPPEEPD